MLKKIAIIALLSLSLVGCKKKPDFTKVKGTATSLVEKYKPQIEKFQATLTGLLARAKALPGSLPGVSKLLAQLGGYGNTLAAAKTTVSGLMGKVDGAIKAGKVADVKKSIEAANTSFAGIETLGDDLVKAEGVLKTLEARAAAVSKDVALSYAKKLSTGFELAGAENGIEPQLISFIENVDAKIDTKTWFNFDRLTFATGSANLDLDKSKAQLTNIAEILKAFPKVNLRVGGYTDNTGEPEGNLKLSQSRADNVVKAVVALGIDAARLSAKGYGQEHPVCAANDTDECKAQNRRIAVRVLQK